MSEDAAYLKMVEIITKEINANFKLTSKTYSQSRLHTHIICLSHLPHTLTMQVTHTHTHTHIASPRAVMEGVFNSHLDTLRVTSPLEGRADVINDSAHVNTGH